MASKWLIAGLLCFNIFIFCDTNELISVVTIFRHGNRAPNFLYTTDPYKEMASEIWPEGFAELTKVGKNQHYRLGKWLRQRYNDFLPEKYTNKFLYVLSSNVDRCLMSVSSNLAGLFPPRGYQIWNEELPWQPIPIHTKPQTQDALLFAGKQCFKHIRLLQEFHNSTTYQNFYKENKFIFDYVSNHTGMEVRDPDYLTAIHDILTIESKANLTLPEWTKLVYPRHTLPIAVYSFSIPALTPELARLKSGPLIDYIASFLENSLYNPETAHKFLMMSGHDTTLSFLLTSLGIFDNSWPEYASSVIFELWNKANDSVVNIYFKNSTDLYPLQLPQCEFDCQLNKFQKIIEPIRVNEAEWEKECVRGENIENIVVPKDPRL
ncbi:lysosomal acid phosphatase-like [Diorhabda sublineata]|uniref:lysosomal acid phosphatase-like n=1 Tax=Diorhabda sublineata TaxID=1163346 RepID=UPI0024E14846|nr:lysosomal acid phosphatase-like [Diorhabda sublineata]